MEKSAAERKAVAKKRHESSFFTEAKRAESALRHRTVCPKRALYSVCPAILQKAYKNEAVPGG